jgi:hypothetical protein
MVAMSEDTGTQELEIGAGDKKLKLRGSDLLTSVIGMIVCSGLVLVGYILFIHKGDAKDHGEAVVQAVKDMGQTAKEGITVQRELNCLIALPQELREKNQEFCKRLSR